MVKNTFSPIDGDHFKSTRLELNFVDELTGIFSTQVSVTIEADGHRSSQTSPRDLGEVPQSSSINVEQYLSSAQKNSALNSISDFRKQYFQPFFELFFPDERTAKTDLSTLSLQSPPSEAQSLSHSSQQATGNYDIEIVFTGRGWRNNFRLKQAFRSAVNRLESIIFGDLPDVQLNGINIDDLRITAELESIDGVGGILGEAGPTRLRGGSALPFAGIMRFDSADARNLFNNGQWNDVILHEMLHVIGFGTIWQRLGLLSGAGTNNPQYIGANGVAAYNNIFGNNATSIPVENTGGPGTADAHWLESIFDTELMTGFLNEGEQLPLSAITAESLVDLGYQLAPANQLATAIDAYSPPITIA